MMYVGLSLGRCLNSILSGEVSEEKVLCIISRTACMNVDSLISVVTEYHESNNYISGRPPSYDISHFPLNTACELAVRLYEQGKIHQPRLFDARRSGQYSRPAYTIDTVWLEVGPATDTSNIAVLDAYSKYKMLLAIVQ